MFDAAGGPAVVLDAAGGPSVVVVEVSNSTRSPAARSTGLALVFAQRSTQNGASIAARSFDAVCDRRSPVLS